MIRDSLITLIALVHPSKWVAVKLPYQILTTTYHNFNCTAYIMADTVDTILTCYSYDVIFTALLTTLEIGVNERSQFTTDGFTSMYLLVKHFPTM